MQLELEEAWHEVPTGARMKLEKAGLTTRKPESLAALFDDRRVLDHLMVQIVANWKSH